MPAKNTASDSITELKRALALLAAMFAADYEPARDADGSYDPGLDGYPVNNQLRELQRGALLQFREMGGDVPKLVRSLESDPTLLQLKQEFRISGIVFQCQLVRAKNRRFFQRWAKKSKMPPPKELELVVLSAALLEQIQTAIPEVLHPELLTQARKLIEATRGQLNHQVPSALQSFKQEARQAGHRPLITRSTFLERVEKYYLPRVARMIDQRIVPLKPALAHQLEAALPSDWHEGGASERNREVTRQTSATVNQLIMELIQTLYPFWGREMTQTKIRNALKHASKQTTSKRSSKS